MQKPLIVLLASALVLTGCSAFKKSQTWQRVVDSRNDRLADGTGKSTQADRLHAVLAAENVEHKIVTYQFRYRTRLREEAVGTGKAVIYRDTVTPDSPWWVMDENAAFPVWVPNENPDRQLSFYLRRNAEVLAQQDFPAGGSHKSFDAAPAIAAPDSAPPMLARARKPATTVIARVKVKRADVEVLAAVPATRDVPAEVLDFAQPDRRFDALFRTTHGTRFDPRSSADRQKMVELRQTLTARNDEI